MKSKFSVEKMVMVARSKKVINYVERLTQLKTVKESIEFDLSVAEECLKSVSNQIRNNQ